MASSLYRRHPAHRRFRRHAAAEELHERRRSGTRNHASLQSESGAVAFGRTHRRRRRHHPALRARHAGRPSNVKLVENGWQSWPKFRQSVAHMHLLLQPSYTESFNMVTADGVAEGVPSVVSHAIDWAPEHWKARWTTCWISPALADTCSPILTRLRKAWRRCKPTTPRA